MSQSPSLSSGEFLTTIKNIVRENPVSAVLSNGAHVKAQFLRGLYPVYALHFDFNQFSGSYRVTEDGSEIEYRAFDISKYHHRQIQEEVIDIRAVLAELIGIVGSQKTAA